MWASLFVVILYWLTFTLLFILIKQSYRIVCNLDGYNLGNKIESEI